MTRRPGDLPPDARAELQRAMKIPDRRQRLAAIDKARERASHNHPDLFKENTHMQVHLKNVRLAFPNLFTPKSGPDGGPPKYNAAFLLPKDHPQVAEIRKAMQEVAKGKWKDKAKDTYNLLEKTDKLALHDGDNKPDLDGYSGNFFVNATNATRPTVVDRNRTELKADSGKPYSGCYVNVILEFWAQDNQYGKRVNASLGGVQFAADGDAFTGGRPTEAGEFDDLGSDGGDTPVGAGDDAW